jgi:hypothetical protein
MKPIFFASKVASYLGFTPRCDLESVIRKFRFDYLSKFGIIVSNPNLEVEHITQLYHDKINIKDTTELKNTVETLSNEVDNSNLSSETKNLHKEVIQQLARSSYGTNNEIKTIELIENLLKIKVIENNQEKFYTEFPKFGLVGLCDGFYIDNQDKEKENKVLVEIKNRTYKFYNHVPIYEYIQVLILMNLTKTYKCLFVERFQNEIRYYYIDYNQDKFKAIIERLSVVSDLIKIINEEKFNSILQKYQKLLT